MSISKGTVIPSSEVWPKKKFSRKTNSNFVKQTTKYVLFHSNFANQTCSKSLFGN